MFISFELTIELLQRTNTFFYRRIYLLPEKWEKFTASNKKYFV